MENLFISFDARSEHTAASKQQRVQRHKNFTQNHLRRTVQTCNCHYGGVAPAVQGPQVSKQQQQQQQPWSSST
jgi:hypothetical protein